MNRPLARLPFRAIATLSFARRLKWLLLIVLAVVLGFTARFAQIEIETSRMQARYLSELGRDIGFAVADGPSERIRFPGSGPYDERLGYGSLPSFQKRLVERGFAVTAQARDSATMASVADRGLFLPYDEKDQAGLQLFDTTGAPHSPTAAKHFSGERCLRKTSTGCWIFPQPLHARLQRKSGSSISTSG